MTTPKLIRVRLHPNVREYEIEVAHDADHAQIVRAVESTAHYHFDADYEEIPYTKMDKVLTYQELPSGVLINGEE